MFEKGGEIGCVSLRAAIMIAALCEIIISFFDVITLDKIKKRRLSMGLYILL